ncbi:MAG: N-acetylneuraminate synthase [Massilibacteroides sp.]|nr:N-acetylneuraminate synthase [Massilibacteroides sp.]MDD3062266.1 N-acetylneuraminate synthase [Massilibacteroides sp.]MDD4660039.1 N-acetylneuraminate synthase [Massilibacteroides sp.]
MKNKTLIIAEAGVNHNGSIPLAKKLIDAAVSAGVDYVKFQTFQAEKLASEHALKADYQRSNTQKKEETQLQMLKKLELTYEQHYELISYCKQKNIGFFSTAFDLESLEFLSSIGLKTVKIPSGEITDLPYLRKASSLFPRVILSTGMAKLQEIREAVQVFVSAGMKKENITILHCTTEYPTPMQEVNLKAMLHLQQEFGTPIGYSDHTIGIEVPIAAVALGATVIEKHFTLDRTMKGPDHKASLEPNELKAMTNAIRNIEVALGNGEKRISPTEEKNKTVARKSIVALKEIVVGELFSNDNLTVKRPGTGLSPMLWDSIIGTKAKRPYHPDELIEL